MAVVVFDLDGTLVEAPPTEAHEKLDLETLARARPIPKVVRYAHRLLGAGHTVVVCTSRSPLAAAATLRNLRRCRLATVDVHHRVRQDFDLDDAVRHKQGVVEMVEAVMVVGDRHDLDGRAARAAGVNFLHVDLVP